MKLKYFVFEAELTELDGSPTGEIFNFCCSSLRWATLEKEIKDNWLVVKDSIRKIHETDNRNEARNIASEY